MDGLGGEWGWWRCGRWWVWVGKGVGVGVVGVGLYVGGMFGRKDTFEL